MLIDNSEALMGWLTSNLSKIKSDADPNALGKYILALLKKNKPEEELYAFCLDQLDVFLLKDTKVFVERLFETLRSKSYIQLPNSFTKAKSPERTATVVNSDPLKSSKGHSIVSAVTSSIDGIVERRRSSRERSRSTTRSRSPISRKSLQSSAKTMRSTSKERAKGKSDPSNNQLRKVPSQKKSSHMEPDFYRSNKHKSKRCKDYDEKGYCMMGDLCRYDHGTDALVVVDDVSALTFQEPSPPQVSSTDSSTLGISSSKPPLPPTPPTEPPPPPPPPPGLPPLPPGPYMTEPYNPEAPGMNLAPQQMSYFPPLHIPPPSHHIPGVPAASTIHNVAYENTPFPPYKPQRTRELIGITISNNTYGNDSNKADEKENGSSRSNDANSAVSDFVPSHQNGKRKFDYQRLGPVPKMQKRQPLIQPAQKGRSTLELRKIPRHLNTIEALNSHFSKFGTIINLQVNYDSDPEAAIVQFSSDAEASAAYRCTDAVLNNRFIKVFYHNKNLSNDNLNKVTIVPTEANNTPSVPLVQPILYTSKKRKEMVNLPTKAMLKKNTIRERDRGKAFSLSRPGQRDLKDATIKRIELYKKKQGFLAQQIQNQKLILQRLSKSKSLPPKEKILLKKLIFDMTDKIQTLQQEIKIESEELKTHLKRVFVSKADGAICTKELLDAELELYNKEHTPNGAEDDTVSLLRRVNDLKLKALSMGTRFDLSFLKESKNENSDDKNVKEKESNDKDDKPKLFDLDDEEEEEEEKESEARSWRR